MNTTADPGAITAEKQEELVFYIRTLMEQIGREDPEAEQYIEQYATDLYDMTVAREQAEKYRELLKGSETEVRVEQRNTRIIFTVVDPPPCI